MGAETTAPLPSTSGSSDVEDERWRSLARQRFVGRVLAPLCIPIATLVMRLGYRWRVRDAAASRALYSRLLRDDPRPLLIVANHLTMADSAVIAWGLGSTLHHVVHYRGLPWNVPEQARVESSWIWRVLAYLMKCVPVARGGDRKVVADVLKGLRHLMQRGEVVLMFPEGGRSRSGRVDTQSVAYGVGRLIKELGNCRVLCVYLRGDSQRSWSNMPAVGDTFSIVTRVVEPRTELRGLRGSRDLARQVLDQLVEMEEEHFENRAQ